MCKRIVSGIAVWITALSALAGQELMHALKETPAPETEYIRTPAKYIFKKMGDTARRSNNPELSTFTIQYELDGCDDVKISINLENYNLLDALKEVAKATGAGIDFQERGIVLKDPKLVEEVELIEPEITEQTPIKEVTEGSGNKDMQNEEPAVHFTDISHAIIFVETGVGRGSGFLAEMNGKTYVFSNQHNFLGAKRIVLKTMNGKFLKPKTFEYSRTHDLVRLLLAPEDTEGLKGLRINFDTPAIGEKIVVYGNSAGGGVATELEGEVLGVGPSDIEVEADFVPGNSGSPILNEHSDVIGVATYATLGNKFEKGSAYDKMFKGTRFAQVRRYGIRIPQEGWVSDSLNFYLRQTYRLSDMENYLNAIMYLFSYWQGDSSHTAIVNQMYSSYGSIATTGEPPFDFHMKEMEEQLRKVVRFLMINHEDLMKTESRTNIYRYEDGTSRIKKMLIEGLSSIKESAGETRWKTTLLHQEAKAIIEKADIVSNAIRYADSPYQSKKQRRR